MRKGLQMTSHARRTALRPLLALVLAVVAVVVLAGTALAATTTTAGADASGAATATTAADASSGGTAGSAAAAVVTPPSAGFTPLNPGVKVASVDLQIWPEYDTKDVLVFMNLTLPAGTTFPATFTYVVPTGARLAGIGEVDPSGNFTYNYNNGPPPTTVGQDGNVVTITLQKYPTVQVEWYYNPGVAVEGARSFPVSVLIPVDADLVNIAVQQPARSTDFTVEPPMGQPVAGRDGLNYVSGTVPAVKAGSQVTTTISYTKSDNEPSNSTTVSTPTQQSTSKWLIYVFVGLIVVVIAFAVYRLWLRPANASGGAGGRSGGTKGRGGSSQSGKSTRSAQGCARHGWFQGRQRRRGQGIADGRGRHRWRHRQQVLHQLRRATGEARPLLSRVRTGSGVVVRGSVLGAPAMLAAGAHGHR